MPSQTRQSRDSSSPILPQVPYSPYYTSQLFLHSSLTLLQTHSNLRATTSKEPRPTHSSSTTTTNRDADPLTLFTASLARLDSKLLQAQRYDLSPAQESTLGMLALGAKLERALEKRIVTQDAEQKAKGSEVVMEKVAVILP